MIRLDQEVYTPHSLGNTIGEILENYEMRAEEAEKYARKTRKEIEDEAKRLYDEKYKQLQEKVNLSYGQFTFPQEQTKWKEFCDIHRYCPVIHHVNGGKYPYVMPVNTGYIMKYIAVCPSCNESEDITYKEEY